MVDATISNQAFSDRRWNIFPGLNYIIIHSKYFPDSDWLKAHV